jgi:hypothetical protein
MKKVLVATILGLGVVASTFAQGRINLNSYNTPSYPQVTYGAGGGGTLNTPVLGSDNIHIGVYFAAGAVATGTDSSGYALISSFAPLLSLGTGTGSTTFIGQGGAGNGWFVSGPDFVLTGVPSGSATVMIVAYNGATYDTSTIRGHSLAFSIVPAQGVATAPNLDGMGAFQILAVPVPEPSTFALAGLGLAGLLIFRRRN